MSGQCLQSSNSYEPEPVPLTIAVSTVGRFADGESWYLSVNSSGNAELTIDTSPTRTRRQFEVSNDQMAKLLKQVMDEQFFDLDEEYGEAVPDGSVATITIIAGGQSKSVRLRYLVNWVRKDNKKIPDTARAIRIIMAIRGWFDDLKAIDLRQSYQKVLDAAKD